MKYPALTLVLVISVLGIAHGAPEKKDPPKKPTYEGLAEEFFKHVVGPANLALRVTDEESLKKAVAKLQASQKQFARLAKEFQKLPVPTDAQKRVMNKVMEKRIKESETTDGEKFNKHLKNMPAKLRNEWLLAMQSFYLELDKHQAVFEKYFGEDEE